MIATLLVIAVMLFAGCTGPADGGNGTVAGADDGAAVGPTDDGGVGAGNGAGADDGAGAGDGMTTETDDGAAAITGGVLG